MHLGLKFDLLCAQMEACRNAGIRTCIYTCVVWNEDWADISQIGVYAGNRVLADAHATNEGVYRILSEVNHLFDFIDYKSDIEKYELVILPDEVAVPDSLKAVLANYLTFSQAKWQKFK